MKKSVMCILCTLMLLSLTGCVKVEKISDSLLLRQTVSNRNCSTTVYRYTPSDFEFEGGNTPLLLVLASSTLQDYIENLLNSGFKKIADEQKCSVVFITPAQNDAFGEQDCEFIKMVAGNTTEVWFPNTDYSLGIDSKGRFLSSHFRIYVFADAAAAAFSEKYLQNPSLDYYVEEWGSMAGGFGAGFVNFNCEDDIVKGFEEVKNSARIFLEDGNSYIDTYHDYQKEGISVSTKSYRCSSKRTIDYIEYWPEDVAKENLPALVVLFHGRATSAAAYAQQSDWPMVGKENGFAVISVCGPYDLFLSKNVGKNLSRDTYEMIKAYAKENGIDPNRIYATGFSQGAYRTLALGSMYPDFFKAIAPCDMVTSKGLSFESEIPTMIIVGDDDFYNVLPSQNKWCKPMIENIAAANGVSLNADENNIWGYKPLSTETLTESAYSITVSTYADNLVLCDVKGMSHNVAPAASRLIWEFFENAN